MPEPVLPNQEGAVPKPPTPPIPRPQPEQVGLRVSLIPAEELDRKNPVVGFRKFVMMAIAITVFFVVIVGYLGIRVFLNMKTISAIDAEVTDMNKQSEQLTMSIKDAKAVQARLRSLTKLLAGHRTGLKILSFLEKHTLPDVAYSTMSTGDDGSVNLAVSAGSFESYAAQINELAAQPEIKSVSASGLSPVYDDKNNLTQVDFVLALSFDPAIFLTKTPAQPEKK